MISHGHQILSSTLVGGNDQNFTWSSFFRRNVFQTDSVLGKHMVKLASQLSLGVSDGYDRRQHTRMMIGNNTYLGRVCADTSNASLAWATGEIILGPHTEEGVDPCCCCRSSTTRLGPAGSTSISPLVWSGPSWPKYRVNTRRSYGIISTLRNIVPVGT